MSTVTTTPPVGIQTLATTPGATTPGATTPLVVTPVAALPETTPAGNPSIVNRGKQFFAGLFGSKGGARRRSKRTKRTKRTKKSRRATRHRRR